MARCSRCDRARAPEAWARLPLVERVVGERIRHLVTHWPEGAVIEVRRCTCGNLLARTVRQGDIALDGQCA